MLQDFFIYLDSNSIKVQKDSIMNNDSEFLKNRIKSELAGSIWGKMKIQTFVCVLITKLLRH